MNMTLNESNSNPSSDILSTLPPMQSKPTVNTTAKGSGTGAVLSIDGTCYLLNSYIALLPISDLIFCLFLLSHYL
ncbi:hypothetical protein PRIPAC_83902 [Pristionchus pacificus]|uniref:Uncharacterized protein n=1 Tax=Pristionchus pacificus TaxID=54126 RepID=A0A2A6BIB5_PRIPA|nr:hypothetical protein PRIPAC_83902 [Pristionchus pacificus]|eukprot:PDM65629.1 hypothetical protein PRIPAC_53637 [Pristionchus pacificus]